MMIRPSVSTPSTSRSSSLIFAAFFRTEAGIDFTARLESSFDEVVQVNYAEGLLAAIFDHK